MVVKFGASFSAFQGNSNQDERKLYDLIGPCDFLLPIHSNSGSPFYCFRHML